MTGVVLIADGSLSLIQYRLLDAYEIFRLIDQNREHLSQNGDITAKKYETPVDVYVSIKEPKNHRRLRLGIWDGNIFVGAINIELKDDNHSAEIGYWLGVQFEGNGYMAKAIQRIIRYAFETLELRKVFAVVVPANVRSINVLKRAGFSEEESLNSQGEKVFFLEKP